MNGVSGLAGWRWLYIIEGLFSICICFAAWFGALHISPLEQHLKINSLLGLPTDPSNAWFLNKEEKHLMKIRAAQRAEYMGSSVFSWREVRISLTDPKVYLS